MFGSNLFFFFFFCAIFPGRRLNGWSFADRTFADLNICRFRHLTAGWNIFFFLIATFAVWTFASQDICRSGHLSVRSTTFKQNIFLPLLVAVIFFLSFTGFNSIKLVPTGKCHDYEKKFHYLYSYYYR